MNKEIISAVAERTGATKKVTSAIADVLFEEIAVALSHGVKVGIRGFGTFDTNERPARTGINPRTKEHIDIPPSVGIRFRASRELKADCQK